MVSIAGHDLNIYVNEDDEYIIDSDTDCPAYDGSATKGNFYSTKVTTY